MLLQCDLKIKVVKNGYNMASTLRIEHLTLVGLPLGCGSPPKVSHNGKRLKNVQSQVDSRSNHVSHKKANVLTKCMQTLI